MPLQLFAAISAHFCRVDYLFNLKTALPKSSDTKSKRAAERDFSFLA